MKTGKTLRKTVEILLIVHMDNNSTATLDFKNGSIMWNEPTGELKLIDSQNVHHYYDFFRQIPDSLFDSLGNYTGQNKSWIKKGKKV